MMLSVGPGQTQTRATTHVVARHPSNGIETLSFKRNALLNTSWPAAENRATDEQTPNKAEDALTKHHHRSASAENVNEYACTLLAMGKLQRSANSVRVENRLYNKTEGSMGEARKAHAQDPDK